MVDGSHDPDVLVAGRVGVDVERPGVPALREAVVRRLEHAEEQQPDADAGGEHHGDPAGVGVVRLGVLAADPDRADRQEDERQAEEEDDVDGEDQEPVELAGQERPEPAEERGRRLLVGQGEKHERDDHQARDQEHRVVDVEAERPDVVLAELEVRLEGGILGSPVTAGLQVCHDVLLFWLD